jgi:hypothetical protein
MFGTELVRAKHPMNADTRVQGGIGVDQHALVDRLLIRELVENCAVWRDAVDRQHFRGVWHDDRRMMATWFQGSCDEFIAVSRNEFRMVLRHPIYEKERLDPSIQSRAWHWIRRSSHNSRSAIAILPISRLPSATP